MHEAAEEIQRYEEELRETLAEALAQKETVSDALDDTIATYDEIVAAFDAEIDAGEVDIIEGDVSIGQAGATDKSNAQERQEYTISVLHDTLDDFLYQQVCLFTIANCTVYEEKNSGIAACPRCLEQLYIDFYILVEL